jgi:ribonuclease VapC
VIVDTSAIIAILKDEPEAEQFLARLAKGSDTLEMSAASYLEAGIVVDRNGNALLSRSLDELLETFAITIVPVTENQAKLARAAYRAFGKGSGHSAGLNFGDCFSYALARELDGPLLFKGDDFEQTDVRRYPSE